MATNQLHESTRLVHCMSCWIEMARNDIWHSRMLERSQALAEHESVFAASWHPSLAPIAALATRARKGVLALEGMGHLVRRCAISRAQRRGECFGCGPSGVAVVCNPSRRG